MREVMFYIIFPFESLADLQINEGSISSIRNIWNKQKDSIYTRWLNILNVFDKSWVYTCGKVMVKLWAIFFYWIARLQAQSR